MTTLLSSATFKILEMMKLCVQRLLNTDRSKFSHTCIFKFLLLVIIIPIRFLVLALILCSTSCDYNRCTEYHALYFKPIVLPLLSLALVIIAAKLR